MTSFAATLQKKETVDTRFDEVLRPVEPTYEPVEGVLNMIWFSYSGIGLSIAEKLIDEGNNVVVAMVQSNADMGIDDHEDAETKTRRLSLFNGIIDKEDAKKVLKKMEKLDRDDWTVWFDFNDMGPFADKALALGFTKGLFPTTEDAKYEQDRNAAKEIVKKHFPDITVAETHEFKSVDDAIEFLEETEGVWVLKGNLDGAKTIVPANGDVEKARRILMDALDAQKKEYEADGFILEEKIQGGLELIPQIVFLDGEVIFTDVDIENKAIGAGNVGIMTGAMQTLIFKTKLSEKINKIAFPDWVYAQAKKHKGIYVTDCGLICKDDKYYFTEFCFQRMGWDAIFAEIAMAGSATDYFTKLLTGDNPLDTTFGVAVRGLNLHKDEKERRVLAGISMSTEDMDNVFLYDCKEEEGARVTAGSGWDLVVFAAADDDPNCAVREAHEKMTDFAFEDMHYRPEFDFMSYEYPSSIVCRYTGLNNHLYDSPHIEGHEKYVQKERMKELEDRLTEALHEEE